MTEPFAEKLHQKIPKFPERDWKAHAEQYYETVKKWRVETIKTLKEIVRKNTDTRPNMAEWLQISGKHLMINKFLEALE